MTHKPFRDLTDAEQGAILLAHHEGKVIQYRWYDESEWKATIDPVWVQNVAYRVAPEPKTPDTINWDHVAPEYNVMARDENGLAFVFKGMPYRKGISWCVAGDFLLASGFASYRRGTCNWQDSLIIRPGYEGE